MPVLLVTLFSVGSFYLSKVLSPLFLLSLLAVIGFGAAHIAFGDLESHFAVVVAFVVSFVLSTQSSSVAAAFMGFPVGLVAAVAVMGWVDEPNQNELQQAEKRPNE